MSADIEYTFDQQNGLLLYLRGDLNKYGVATVWQKISSLKLSKVKKIVVDAKQISSFDTAGAVFINEMSYLFKVDEVSFQNIPEGLNKLLRQLDKVCQEQEKEDVKPEAVKRNFLTRVGAYTMSVLNQVHHNLRFTGEVTYYLIEALTRPKRVRWKDVWFAIENVGPNALPIIALLGFLIGLILSFQASVQLQKFGAMLFVINIVAVGMAREMAPLFTAILLAGRTSSAFAAEIGTMKVNQEIDALATMGLPSVRFLVVPKVIAVTLMLPLLSVFMIFFSLLGCGVFMVANSYPWSIFMNQLYSSVSLGDFWGGFIKAIIFGVLVSAIGCFNGLKTASGASAVGQSTTQAVVSTIVTLVVVDGILAVIFYSIGA